jgi:hypothetical protein
MLKIIFLILISLKFSLGDIPDPGLEEYLNILKEKAKAFINEMGENKNVTKIEIMNENAIEAISQSAKVKKVNGVKDEMLPYFIRRFIDRLELPEEILLEVRMTLEGIIENKSNEWKSYKLIYNKNEINSTLHYVCILAQHDNIVNKSNWFYTDINTQVNKTDVFVISESSKVGSKVEENIKVVKKPSQYNQNEIDLMMEYYETVAIKTFSNYFGEHLRNLNQR